MMLPGVLVRMIMQFRIEYAAMKDEDYKTIKEWYGEWQKIPTLLATTALALLAFSLTNLLPKSPQSRSVILHWCWVSLAASTFFASVSLFAGYTSFEIVTRAKLSDVLKSMSMKVPASRTKWVSHLGRVSHRFAMVSLLTLLAGAIGLVFYALQTR